MLRNEWRNFIGLVKILFRDVPNTKNSAVGSAIDVEDREINFWFSFEERKFELRVYVQNSENQP